MKVIALNGSPKARGNTYHALKTLCDALKTEDIDAEIIQIGNLEMKDCIACGRCENGQCIFFDSKMNEVVEKIHNAEGLILGSPVYYAGISGSMKSFLDRLFYASKDRLRHKVAASVVIPRRSGGVAAFNQLNQYFLLSEMLIAPSYYWNVVYGGSPEEIYKDAEGMSILNNLARNIAWLIKMKEMAKDCLPTPEAYPRSWTNFIRE